MVFMHHNTFWIFSSLIPKFWKVFTKYGMEFIGASNNWIANMQNVFKLIKWLSKLIGVIPKSFIPTCLFITG